MTDESVVYVAVRRDLKMRRGKEIAQGIHAVGALGYAPGCPVVVCQVADGIALSDLVAAAYSAGVPYAVTRDAGRTEVPRGAMTAIAIGPVERGRIDALGKLELY